jgi:hypothetical protein
MRMMRMQRVLPALTALTLLAAALPAPARADEGMVIQGSVDTMQDNGQTIGCQASFAIVRRDMEYGDGAGALAVGSLAILQVDGAPKVALKFGVVDMESAEKQVGSGGGLQAKAPVKAVLLEDGGDGKTNNGSESLGVAPDERGFGVYMFEPGPMTRRVLAQAGRNGRFKIAYVMKEGGPLVRVSVDVTVSKRDMQLSDNTVIDAQAAPRLSACLAQVLKAPPPAGAKAAK